MILSGCIQYMATILCWTTGLCIFKLVPIDSVVKMLNICFGMLKEIQWRKGSVTIPQGCLLRYKTMVSTDCKHKLQWCTWSNTQVNAVFFSILCALYYGRCSNMCLFAILLVVITRYVKLHSIWNRVGLGPSAVLHSSSWIVLACVRLPFSYLW
jgi:glycerol-3-phosphate acyltransferase PlsY